MANKTNYIRVDMKKYEAYDIVEIRKTTY